MTAEEILQKWRKRTWEYNHPGQTYPGKFTKEMRSKSALMVTNTEGWQIARHNSKWGGLKSNEWPTIPLHSRAGQLILGSLLGDGSISGRGRFSETHCTEQKEIILEAARLFSNIYNFRNSLPGKEPMISVRRPISNYHIMKYGTEKRNYQVTLPRLPILQQLRAEWYPEGKKCLPNNLHKEIKTQSLAWWYLGDGSYSKGGQGSHFCSAGFSREDNQYLCTILITNGFESAKIGTKKNIYLNKVDSIDFLARIAEYIMPTMRYKLGPLEPEYRPYNPLHYSPEPLIFPLKELS